MPLQTKDVCDGGDVLETKVAHNNKDLISKILADTFGSKSFAVYGLNLPPIAEYLPTEFPAVAVTDRISDRIFKLVDGSYVIVDFESGYRRVNKIKYLNYATRVAEKYFKNEKDFRLRIIVIYTGDVQTADPDFSIGCITMKTEQAFLSHIDGDAEMEKIREKLSDKKSLNDEDLMRLIILPLTYKGDEKKTEMIDAVINSAEKIAEEDKKTFVLAGVCVAAHHYLTDMQVERIGGLLKMTKVGQLFERERISYGNEQRREGVMSEKERTAEVMLKHGDEEAYVMEVTGLTQTEIDKIREKIGGLVTT